MGVRSFSLQPFPATDPRPLLELKGSMARRGAHVLCVRYVLVATLDELVIPAATQATTPARKDGLWKETCFELFIAAGDSPGYWELNLSPAGHWNGYRFESYRLGMREEARLTSLPFTVQVGPRSLVLALDLDLAVILPEKQPVDVGISAVIKHGDGELTYWALSHRGPRPDFHRRDGFIIRI